MWYNKFFSDQGKILKIINLSIYFEKNLYYREVKTSIMLVLTYLKNAQLITFIHYLMSYFDMIRRNSLRFQDRRERLNEFQFELVVLSSTLFYTDSNFVSILDIDYTVELLSSTSVYITNFSHLFKKVILWRSCCFKFIELPDKVMTCNFTMTEESDSEVVKLIAATKIENVFLSLNALLTVTKGFLLSFNKNVQEGKNLFFLVIRDLHLDVNVANWLVKIFNISYCYSYKVVKKIVKIVEEKNCRLSKIGLEKLQKIESKITSNIFSFISVSNSVLRRIKL